MVNDIYLLIYLKRLIINECNKLLEIVTINQILLKYNYMPKNNELDKIVDDLNDFYYLNKKAGEVDDLKVWMDDDYFKEYFTRVTNSIEKNFYIKKFYDEFLNSCKTENKYLDELSASLEIKKENLLIYRYILNKALNRKTKHKLINYVIDALNIHAALLEDLNAYFITRDKESIRFFKSIESIDIDIEDKKKFLNNFLITKNN